MSAPAETKAGFDSLSLRVGGWRRLLDDVGALSPRYRARYAAVLAHLERSASAQDIKKARAALTQWDAQGAASILAGTANSVVPPPRAGAGEPPSVRGSGLVLRVVRDMVTDHPDITAWVTTQPHLAQTAVPLHPSREAHLVRSAGYELVALRWSAESVTARSAHQHRMANVLDKVSASAPLQVVAHDEYAVVHGHGEDPWVFAPNLGHTLEDRLRWDEFAAGERDLVLASLAELRRVMVEAGVVWQGFAPRNMFLRERQLVLIDFEEVVEAAADPVRAAECLLWHRIFFADCLTSEETARLFTPLDGDPEIVDDQVREADAFECALLGAPSVTWRQRQELLEASVALEGRHIRPAGDRDGGILFGHELGHFWGDFVPVEDEARLFSALSAVTDADRPRFVRGV